MSTKIVERKGSMVPVRVRKATSARAEVLEPFQYYSEPGEQIYSLDFSSQAWIARLYLHLDADGNSLAQVLLQEGRNEMDLAEWLDDEVSKLNELEASSEDFVSMLREMHLAAEADPSQIFDRAELDGVLARSRNAPVVIGGCGRSGTTLLLSVLAAHPALLAFPEELYAFYPKPFRLRGILDAIAENEKNAEWQRWCEKTPKNVRAFDDIHAAFAGNVRLIHIVRDGRDVVSSHHPNASERYYVSPERWVADVRAGLEQRDNTLLIRYEDLVGDTESTIRKVCEFIEEPYDSRMLNFEQHSTVKENKAWEGGRVQALHEESVGRWKSAEHEERVQVFMQTLGTVELLEELGYL